MCRRWWRSSFTAMLLVLGMGFIGFAQQSATDTQKEIEALKQGQQEILKELHQIKAMLQKQQPQQAPETEVRDVVFELGNNPVRGKDTAKLVMIEFTDYQ
jgi:protein-disulfide isomerase